MTIDTSHNGPWRELFAQALRLLKGLPQTNPPQRWTFGGGTVLMLRHHHRLSKDIDLFVEDPQVLGYLNPRLSDNAEAITSDYVEAAEYIKLFLPQGEIDIVVSPSLTDNPWEEIEIFGQAVLVETAAEIIAKKMYYRGNQAKGRDLFRFRNGTGARAESARAGKTPPSPASRCFHRSTDSQRKSAADRIRRHRHIVLSTRLRRLRRIRRRISLATIKMRQQIFNCR